jgi:hypothetical protein
MEFQMTPDAQPDRQTDYQPTAEEVHDLLRRAAHHPLGTGLLLDGSLDAVAATFRVHAFCVDAARDTLRREAPALR